MNKKLTVLGTLLMAVAVTGYSVAGTYAKYTEQFDGPTASAKVAKWAVSVDTTKSDFNLFKTTANNSTVDGRVAPGGTGSAKFNYSVVGNGTEVEYTTTVTAKIDKTVLVEITDEQAGKLPTSVVITDTATGTKYYAPIQFTLDGTPVEVTMADGELTATLDCDAENQDYELAWSWAYELDDETAMDLADRLDTNLGKAATAEVSVSVSFDVTQNSSIAAQA